MSKSLRTSIESARGKQGVAMEKRVRVLSKLKAPYGLEVGKDLLSGQAQEAQALRDASGRMTAQVRICWIRKSVG